MFRTILEGKLQTAERKSNAGRPPIDPVLIFKHLPPPSKNAEICVKIRKSFAKFAKTKSH